MVQIMTQKRVKGRRKRIVRVSVGVFAWIPLGFQLAAMYLLGQSLKIFSSGPVLLARYGITSGIVLVAAITSIGVMSDDKGKRKLLTVVSCGLLSTCKVCQQVIRQRSHHNTHHQCPIPLNPS